MNPIRYILLCLLTLLCIPSLQAQELHKVTLQLQWKHQFEFAGFYAAIHKGYYTQRGLHVEFSEYKNDLDVVEEVLSGRAQYALYHNAIIRARLEGKPVKLLANYFKRLPLVILTSPQINGLAGLRGKRLMIAAKDLNSPLLKVAFEREGLRAGQDIEIVPHTFSADPFIQGKVEAMSAFITNEPFYLEQQNIDFNVIELSDYMRSMGDLYLFTSDAQADKYPKQTRNFIEATNEGWRYALEHEEEIVDLILASYSQRKSREALLYEAKKTHEMIMPLTVPIGSIFQSLIGEIATLIMNQEGIEDKGYLRDFLFDSKATTQKIVLTAEEQAYLSSMKFHRQLSYGWMPFMFKDKDGKIIGLSEDYWALIRDKLGINEDTTGSPIRFTKMLEAMQQGKTDLFPSTSHTKDREAYAAFSESFEEFPIAIATRKSTEFIFNTSTLNGQIVAVGRNYSAYHMMKTRYPGIKFLQVTNTKEALECVMAGDAYAAIDILPVLQYQINRLASEDIKLGGVTDVQFPVQVMVRKEHARLIPLINRAIASITPEERTVIHRKWMMHKVISAPDYTLLWQILAGGLLMIALILLWNRRMAREIIRRKHIEEQLRKLSRAVEQSHNSIVITDLDAIIEYVNPAFACATGYVSEEAIGQNPRMLKSGYQKAPFYQAMWDTLAQNGVWKGELCNKRKDDSLYWEFVTISSIKDESGKTTHYVAVKEDISDRKKAAKEKEKLTAQLHQAQKLESIGLMAGGVAHDLNNILSGVVGYPELILHDLPEKSKLRKPIETIMESGKMAAAVVADLLTVARGVASTRESHSLNTLIREYLNSPECVKLKSHHPQVAWQDQLTTAQATISCSAVHVKKCLMNLVTNAAEAVSDNGTVMISTSNQDIDITAAGELNKGAYVVVSVQDTGPGIAKEDLEHIFEPFYTKKVMGKSGTGLGLTVVWNTMEDHDGKVTVESNEKGTCFRLYFPLRAEIETTPSSVDNVNIRSTNNEYILVVDDEPHLRDIASQMLHSLGYKVDVVSSGDKAVQFVKDTKIDLIVLDMLMEPGINGRQTYEAILQLYPNQKAIIASGFSESDDVKATLKLGASGFIKKPYTMDTLGRAIKEALMAS